MAHASPPPGSGSSKPEMVPPPPPPPMPSFPSLPTYKDVSNVAPPGSRPVASPAASSVALGSTFASIPAPSEIEMDADFLGQTDRYIGDTDRNNDYDSVLGASFSTARQSTAYPVPPPPAPRVDTTLQASPSPPREIVVPPPPPRMSSVIPIPPPPPPRLNTAAPMAMPPPVRRDTSVVPAKRLPAPREPTRIPPPPPMPPRMSTAIPVPPPPPPRLSTAIPVPPPPPALNRHALNDSSSPRSNQPARLAGAPPPPPPLERFSTAMPVRPPPPAGASVMPSAPPPSARGCAEDLIRQRSAQAREEDGLVQQHRVNEKHNYQRAPPMSRRHLEANAAAIERAAPGVVQLSHTPEPRFDERKFRQMQEASRGAPKLGIGLTGKELPGAISGDMSKYPGRAPQAPSAHANGRQGVVPRKQPATAARTGSANSPAGRTGGNRRPAPRGAVVGPYVELNNSLTPDSKDVSPPQLMAMACDQRDWWRIMTLAREHGPAVTSVHAGEERWTALHHAALNNKDTYAQQLALHCAAPVNAVDVQGDTPLIIAIQNSSVRVARMLIVDANADVEIEGRFGLTALHWCSEIENETGATSIADTLLTYGAIAAVEDEAGKTPLHWAALAGKTRLCALLLVRGGLSAIDRRDCAGRTALFNAADKGHGHIVQILLQRGANGKITDIEGTSVYDAAKRGDHVECAKLLKKFKGVKSSGLVDQEPLTPNASDSGTGSVSSLPNHNFMNGKDLGLDVISADGLTSGLLRDSGSDALSQRSNRPKKTDGAAEYLPKGYKSVDGPSKSSGLTCTIM